MNLETLNFSIRSKEQDIKKIENEIGQIKTEIENIKNEISLLNERKRRLDYSKVIKAPTPSIHPVFPKKKRNVVLSFILSFIFFSFLAFFLEYLEKQKKIA